MAVTNDLLTDRRVLRHAATLRAAGMDVTLIGRKDLRVRAPRRWRFYAEYNLRLLWRLLGEQCDVVWANDTDTLPACWLAARLRRKCLVMDSHEIFPEVPELVGRNGVKRVWEMFEKLLLPRCDANITVCQSLADYYRQRYGVEMTVVRNVPDCGSRPSDLDHEPQSEDSGVGGQKLKMLLYQGAVNVGRGIDWAIEAVGRLPQCRLVVAGVGDVMEEMQTLAATKPWRDRIVFLGRLLPADLERLTPQASVGLVMLEDRGLNYHYALPNRIGDFVAAGVPMVVSDLPEMAAVVRRFGVGEVMKSGKRRVESEVCFEVQALVEAIERVMAREWSDEDFAEARADMDWNNEKQKLLAVFQKLKVEKTKRQKAKI